MLKATASSQDITAAEFEAMQKDAVVLEKDYRGIKVMKLPTGDIFKIFRIRGRISGAYFYSYAKRFCRNANRLKKLAIPTVIPKQIYTFTDSSKSAVLYAPLIGRTLKEILYAESLDEHLCNQLGEFMANLHTLGIHFRSLHLGNIVLTPAGKLGLIDISDMSIYAWSLHCHTRVRGIKRMMRYQKDMKKLSQEKWAIVMKSYFDSSKLSARNIRNIQSKIN